jgi:hypothetical protein
MATKEVEVAATLLLIRVVEAKEHTRVGRYVVHHSAKGCDISGRAKGCDISG